jgi:hypothetical protein
MIGLASDILGNLLLKNIYIVERVSLAISADGSFVAEWSKDYVIISLFPLFEYICMCVMCVLSHPNTSTLNLNYRNYTFINRADILVSCGETDSLIPVEKKWF